MREELEAIRNRLENEVQEVTGSPMVGSIVFAYTFIDEDGDPQWNWIAAGNRTATNLLGLAEGVAGNIRLQMFRS